MEFSPGAIILDDIIGGTLLVGEIPNARLETNLTALADALTAGGKVPHANLTDYLATLAAALTAGGIVPNTKLTDDLRDLAAALYATGVVPNAKLAGETRTLANALTAGGKVPHANLTGELVTLAGALAANGIVPLSKLTRAIPFGQNAGNVTLTAAETTILSLDCGTVPTGCRICVWGYAIYTKQAGAAGAVTIGVKKGSGTATISWYYDATQADHNLWNVAQTEVRQGQYAAVGRVSVGGTLVLKHYGYSIGANAVVGLGDGQVCAYVTEV